MATGNLIYFLGAFYLYFINSVFISLATFLGVRVMHFQRKEFVDKDREKKVRKYIVLIAILTMCPAVYLTVGITSRIPSLRVLPTVLSTSSSPLRIRRCWTRKSITRARATKYVSC